MATDAELERWRREVASELNLSEGDPERAEESPAEKRRTARATGISSRPKPKTGSTRKTAAQKAEDEIVQRINATFERIADAFDSRGDAEMAAIFREEQLPMSTGLVNLTRNVTPLRGPLMMGLNIIEPLLAFGRLGRELVSRWAERRARKQAEWDAMQAEQNVSENAYQPAFQ